MLISNQKYVFYTKGILNYKKKFENIIDTFSPLKET